MSEKIRVIPIMSFRLAKHLLAAGYRIVDLKANRKDQRLTVFVFESDDRIMDEVEAYRKSVMGNS